MVAFHDHAKPGAQRRVIPTLEAFIRLFHLSNRARAFDSHQRATAIAWLLGCEEETVSRHQR
jgi:hypothetical protein